MRVNLNLKYHCWSTGRVGYITTTYDTYYGGTVGSLSVVEGSSAADPTWGSTLRCKSIYALDILEDWLSARRDGWLYPPAGGPLQVIRSQTYMLHPYAPPSLRVALLLLLDCGIQDAEDP